MKLLNTNKYIITYTEKSSFFVCLQEKQKTHAQLNVLI